MKINQKIIFCFFVLVIVFLLPINNVLGASFGAFGEISLVDNRNILANNINISSYKLGDTQAWRGTLTKDSDKLSYRANIENLVKNDQIVVLAEAREGDDPELNGYFGGVTTVIGDKELQSGIIGQLNIEMLILPVPEFESYDDKMLKICWRGINDFSIVGYEIFRSEDKLLSGQDIGRSGQSADKKVCFVDSTPEKDKTYYYTISAITSWNAGVGKEVKISSVKSAISDGLRLGLGVVDKRTKVESDVISTPEPDTSMVAVTDNVVSDTNQKIASLMSRVTDKIQAIMQQYNLSWQYLALIAMAFVLLVVILFFILSVQLANIRSHKKDVWGK